MMTKNCSTTIYDKFIFQRKTLQNLKRMKLDIRTFNVLMAFDGKRSVGDISHYDMYDQTFMEEKIQLLLKLSLIEPVTKIEKRTNLSSTGQPLMNSGQPAQGFEIKQITNKLYSSLVKFIILFKVPLFWCVAGCGLAAFLLTSVPIAMKSLKRDATASLLSPALGLDAVHEMVKKFSNIESKTTNSDRAQANGQGKGAVLPSTELSNTVSTPPLKVPAARPAEDQPEEIQVDSHTVSPFFKVPAARPAEDQPEEIQVDSHTVPTPPFKIPAVRPAEDQPEEIQVDFHKDVEAPAHTEQVKTKPSSAKVPDGPLAQKSVTAPLAQANGQVKVPAARPAQDQPKEIQVDFHKDVKAPAHPKQEKTKPSSAKVPDGPLAQKSVTAPLAQANGQVKVPAARPAENQPKEIQVDFHKDVKAPAHPKQEKTKPSSAKVPDGPRARKSVTAPLAQSKRSSKFLKKTPPTSKLPHLTVKKITSKMRPVSETEFLHYLDQAGPGSNWKEILLYASRLWRLEAPKVEKYGHFSNYLENYNKDGKYNKLAIHSAICTLDQLKVFNMPAILEFRHPRQGVSKYLVIKEIDYQKAVLSNGKSKDDIIITHQQLDRFWSGISHIPWKKVIRSADSINTKSPPAAVKELKAYLNSVGFHNLGDPEMYNRRTVSAIRQIQTRFGIPSTGVVDVMTHAAFNRYRDRIHNQAGQRHKT